MKFALTQGQVTSVDADLLIVPVTLTSATADTSPAHLDPLNEALDLDVLAHASLEGFKGKPGQTWLLRGARNLGTSRLLLVGIGDDATGAFVGAATAARQLRTLHVQSIVLHHHNELMQGILGHIIQGVSHGAYAYGRYVTPKDDDAPELKLCTILNTASDAHQMEMEFDTAIAVCDATRRARDLVNTPPQDQSPVELAKSAQEIADECGLKATIFDEDHLEREQFNLIMAVGKGSNNPPRLIHLVYTPASKQVRHKIAFVGKGVTFDTGGYNIKTGGYMMHMHSDMAGGAAVLGAAAGIGKLAPDGVEVHFIVPTVDNSIDGNAMRPNDIYKGYGGKTVEIHNTDAEGRLILADALAYAQEQGVDTIVDLATLTGACVVALGDYTAALFTNEDTLADELLGAAKQAGEDLWRMPLTQKLDAQLNTPMADMKNLGKRMGGAITAALFLKRWVELDRWAHMDIAGPAFSEASDDTTMLGGTGYGVATLIEFATKLGAQVAHKPMKL